MHLAWYAEHGSFWTAPENLDWVGATLALLRAFREAGGERAVVAGSCAEYAWDGEGRCIEGTTPLRPATLYGAAKHAAHVAAEAYASQEGLSLAWGRIFFSFGPGEAPGRLIPSVAGALLRGEEAPVTGGEQVRDFLAVEELGDAFAALLDSDVEGAVNVASGRGAPVRDLVAMVARAAGGEDLVRYGALPPAPGDPARSSPTSGGSSARWAGGRARPSRKASSEPSARCTTTPAVGRRAAASLVRTGPRRNLYGRRGVSAGAPDLTVSTLLAIVPAYNEAGAIAGDGRRHPHATRPTSTSSSSTTARRTAPPRVRRAPPAPT